MPRRELEANSEKKKKKVRRGTRGIKRCAPLYNKAQDKGAEPETEEEVEEQEAAAEEDEFDSAVETAIAESSDKSPYTQRLSELSEQEQVQLDVLTSEAQQRDAESFQTKAREAVALGTPVPTRSASSGASSGVALQVLGAAEKKRARPSGGARPQSPERPEVSRRVAQQKLEDHLYSVRQYQRVLRIFEQRGWTEFEQEDQRHLLSTGWFYRHIGQDHLADLIFDYLSSTEQLRVGGAFEHRALRPAGH